MFTFRPLDCRFLRIPARRTLICVATVPFVGAEFRFESSAGRQTHRNRSRKVLVFCSRFQLFIPGAKLSSVGILAGDGLTGITYTRNTRHGDLDAGEEDARFNKGTTKRRHLL